MIIDREGVLRASEHGNLLLRDMRSDDLVQVLSIENNAQASPWSRLSFEESLTKQHRCRVIDAIDARNKASKVIAYHVVCGILDELHILNVVAAPQFQGLGLGHMLMSDILSIAEEENLVKIFLEVRASNQVAQSLYLKWQFKQIAQRKKYYRPTSRDGIREDAFVFMRKIQGQA